MRPIIVVSDLHLDAVSSGVPRFEDVRRALRQSVERAKQLEAIWMCLGDVTDPGVRSYRAIAEAIEVARELDKAGVSNLWLAGNHDVVEDGRGTTTLSPLKAAELPFTAVADRPSVAHFDRELSVLCLPYVPSAVAYDPAEAVGRLAPELRHSRRLVVGHLDHEDAAHGSESGEMAKGRPVFWPTDALREHLPDALLLGGHLHRRQVIGDVQIVGSLERLAFDEEHNQPGYLQIEM